MVVAIADLVNAMKVDKELLGRLTRADWDSIDGTYERYAVRGTEPACILLLHCSRSRHSHVRRQSRLTAKHG